MYVCAYACEFPQKLKEGIEFYGAGVIGRCEALDVDVRNRTWVSNSKHV